MAACHLQANRPGHPHNNAPTVEVQQSKRDVCAHTSWWTLTRRSPAHQLHQADAAVCEVAERGRRSFRERKWDGGAQPSHTHARRPRHAGSPPDQHGQLQAAAGPRSQALPASTLAANRARCASSTAVSNLRQRGPRARCAARGQSCNAARWRHARAQPPPRSSLEGQGGGLRSGPCLFLHAPPLNPSQPLPALPPSHTQTSCR